MTRPRAFYGRMEELHIVSPRVLWRHPLPDERRTG